MKLRDKLKVKLEARDTFHVPRGEVEEEQAPPRTIEMFVKDMLARGKTSMEIQGIASQSRWRGQRVYIASLLQGGVLRAPKELRAELEAKLSQIQEGVQGG